MQYTFYVRLMNGTRQLQPEASVVVDAVNEVQGRFFAAQAYAKMHDISVWENGIVVESMAQRSAKESPAA